MKELVTEAVNTVFNQGKIYHIIEIDNKLKIISDYEVKNKLGKIESYNILKTFKPI